MKSHLLNTVIIAILSTLSPLYCLAQDEKDSIRIHHSDTIRNMTEEELLKYSDSIYHLMYPQPTEIDNYGVNASRTDETPLRVINDFQNNTHVPSSVTPDHTKKVGEILVESGMTPTGAKTYNVPINVYAPEGGFAPSISLAYNSQQGNGVMGMGWSVGGLQFITRGNKSIYYDEETFGINMDIDDAFYLNGTRLIKTTSSSSEIHYESETGHIMAVAHCSENIISYFEVFYPNGYHGIFGTTYNTSNKYIYPLTSLTDDKERTISYVYVEDALNCRVLLISYNSCIINFEYEYTRPDRFTYYRNGDNCYVNERLTGVSCSYNNNELHRYTLSYELQDDVSVLTEIGYEAGGEELNPLKFYYGTNATASLSSNNSVLTAGINFTNPSQVTSLRGRFDYNKSEDGLINYATNDPYWMIQYGNMNRIYNQYSTSANIYLYTGLSDAYVFAATTLTTGQYFIQMLCADLDGKQEENPIKINSALDPLGINENIIFTAYQNNHLGSLSQKYVKTFIIPTKYTDAQGYPSIIPKDYFTGDFDGDGRMEILAVSANNPFGESNHPTKCYIFDLRTGNILMDSSPITYTRSFNGVVNAPVLSDYIFCIDYNGDGKTDLCHINGSNMTLVSFKYNTSGTLIPQNILTYSSINKYDIEGRNVIWGDYNGDGLLDILLSPSMYNPNSTTWKLYINKGNADFVLSTFYGTSLYTTTSSYMAQDMDGDGRTELIRKDGTSIKAYSYVNYSFTESYSYTLADQNAKVVPVSINASTSTNTLFSFKDSSVEKIACLRDRRTELLATGMVNSLGVVEKNYYQLALDGLNSSFYTYGYDAVFPYVNISEPITILAKNEKYLGGSLFDHNYHYYNNAVLHRQGLGFCGFGKITSVNYKGQSEVMTFNPYNFGTLASRVTPTKEVSYTYDTTVQANKTRKNNITGMVDEDLLKNVTWTTSYTYDSYDQPTAITSSTTGYQIAKQYTYSHLTNLSQRYQLGIVNTESETITKGNTSYTTSASVNARNSKYLPTSITKLVNGYDVEHITRTYNYYGLPTSETLSKYNSTNSLTTTNVYNYSYQLTSSTDALGNSVSYTYDSYGRVASETDNTGTTTFSYDEMGRVVETHYPDGSTTGIAYAWTSNGYKVTTTSTTSPTTTVFYDARNRETQTARTVYDGSVKIDKTYDEYGRINKISIPYTSSSASSWDEFSYDNYDRIAQESKATGPTISYSYSGNTMTVSNGQNTVVKTFDAMGRLAQVTDNSGTTTYSLHANGSPLSINVLGNNVTFTYDSYGRRTSMSDPSHGTTSYVYDADGNTSEITDANGNTTEITYDQYGRMTSKEHDEFTTTYTYNNTFNKLASVTSTNGTSTTITYDTYGRVSVSRENATSNVWFQQTHTYDSSGKITSTAYESNNGVLGTENYTYTNQTLSQVKWGTNSIFKLYSTSPQGLPALVESGSVNRIYAYLSNGLPAARLLMKEGHTLKNQVLLHDSSSGNITGRRDFLTNITENFSYDALDRLTSYGGVSVSYDNYGNITSKGDVGTYGYNDSDKPFAVTDVTLNGTTLLGSQSIAYTSFNRPESISENGYTATFTYNANDDRVRMVMQHNNVDSLTRYYLGGRYEADVVNGSTTERLYLGGSYYDGFAVLIKQGNTSSVYHISRDHLGSITHIFDSNGTIVQELSYDAWGRLRNPQNQVVYAPGSEPVLLLGRGYCGHEHLREFGLINMNARLYDPMLGRFLSPDPYVQMPDFSQNYNRFSYCMNSPLMYNDITGEYFGIDDLIAGIVGGIINLGANLLSGNLDNIWEGLAAFGAGAVAGIGALYPEAGGWLWGGAIVGATNSWIAGGSIGNMILDATIGAISSYTGGLAGKWVAKNLGGLIINSFHIESPLLGGAVNGLVAGAASGYASGTVSGFLYTGDIGKAHKMGISGLTTGGITGCISGSYSALLFCRSHNINPLTGKSESPFYMTEKEFIKSYYHSNSNDHHTSNKLGIPDDALQLHILDLIEENSYLLHQNQNTLRVDINNVQMILRVNIDGLLIRSYNLFPYNGGYIRSATPVYHLPNQYW